MVVAGMDAGAVEVEVGSGWVAVCGVMAVAFAGEMGEDVYIGIPDILILSLLRRLFLPRCRFFIVL